AIFRYDRAEHTHKHRATAPLGRAVAALWRTPSKTFRERLPLVFISGFIGVGVRIDGRASKRHIPRQRHIPRLRRGGPQPSTTSSGGLSKGRPVGESCDLRRDI